MLKQTKLITNTIKPNQNISFPIGTTLTIQKYFNKLNISKILQQFKKRGRDIGSLTQGLVSYKLTENLSISKASNWMNKKELLNNFNLKEFHEKTLYRTLEIIGENKEKILSDIQDNLFEKYNFEHTDVTIDWTSLIIWGEMCKLAKHGFSKQKRFDKKQINLGIAELSSPINVPIGITVSEGNVPDMIHFKDSFDQIKEKLRPGSRIVFDKGANSLKNINSVLSSKMKYVTLKRLNKSDDKRIQEFDKSKAELIDKKRGIYGIKFTRGKRNDHFYFSEELARAKIESKKRNALKMLNEAREMQNSIDKNRKLPKKFQIKNKLIDMKYSYQTKLGKMDEDEALDFLENESITGREGFFCIISDEDLTVSEALSIYRKKDSVEKMIHSLKNEIEIKPLRVWSENSIYGAIIIGFIAQLIMSLIKYENEELRHVSVKFIRNSLMNLTVTVVGVGLDGRRRIYSNFDWINEVVLIKRNGIP